MAFHAAASALGCLSDIGEAVAVLLAMSGGDGQAVFRLQGTVKGVAYAKQKQVLPHSRLYLDLTFRLGERHGGLDGVVKRVI